MSYLGTVDHDSSPLLTSPCHQPACLQTNLSRAVNKPCPPRGERSRQGCAQFNHTVSIGYPRTGQHSCQRGEDDKKGHETLANSTVPKYYHAVTPYLISRLTCLTRQAQTRFHAATYAQTAWHLSRSSRPFLGCARHCFLRGGRCLDRRFDRCALRVEPCAA